jgi:carboxyl-terminal processing protease
VVLSPEMSRIADVLAIAGHEVERELGGRPEIVAEDPGRGSRWILRLAGSEPAHVLDRKARLLITEGPTIDAVFDALSTLRELALRADGRWPVRDCADVEEMIARIRETVADSWPSFALRGIDWAALCARHVPRVRAAEDPVDAAARWIAALGDAHTAVRPATPLGRLRYGVRVDDRAVLWEVPEESAAWRAGVRPGFELKISDVRGLLERTGASPHARAWVAGLAAVSAPVGERRTWTAIGPSGLRTSWEEPASNPFDPPHLEAGQLRSGAGYLRLHAFAPDAETALHGVLDRLAPLGRLVVDLRGNTGGNLAMAWRFRNRFLHEPATMGDLRTTLPGGRLGPPIPITAIPSEHPFRGQVRFLTDARTYSAAEDALLGLQGLPHVEVFGRPSGGGSGRIRRIRLLAGTILTVSTALTRDRAKRTVESNGIPVDRRVQWTDPTRPDPVLEAADHWPPLTAPPRPP